MQMLRIKLVWEFIVGNAGKQNQHTEEKSIKHSTDFQLLSGEAFSFTCSCLLNSQTLLPVGDFPRLLGITNPRCGQWVAAGVAPAVTSDLGANTPPHPDFSPPLKNLQLHNFWFEPLLLPLLPVDITFTLNFIKTSCVIIVHVWGQIDF